MSEELDSYIQSLEKILKQLDTTGRPPNPHMVNLLVGLAVAQGLKDIEARLETLDAAISDLVLDVYRRKDRSEP